MSQHFRFDASRSLTALEQDSTIVAMIEMSQTKWLVAALVPGVERQPLKKFDAHEETLLKLLRRWRQEAGQAGRNIKRIVVAFEAGRDGFRSHAGCGRGPARSALPRKRVRSVA
jgi:transposase